MDFMILLVPETFVSGSFAGTYQNLLLSISEFRDALLPPLIDRQSYSCVLLAYL
jgi:hypothetical protein